MGFSPFDPVDEDQSNLEVQQTLKAVSDAKATATPEVAKRISDIYKKSPYIPASVIIAMAKSGTSDGAVNTITNLAGKQMVATNNPNKPKNESWFERNVYGKAKAASRWSFAALQLLPDLVQNAGAEAFSANDPEGINGFFKSTNLGTMLADSGQAGTGFFIGKEAATNQAARAREFRGTINGSAWTVGRGAAQLAFTPGSKAYSVISGFLDAGVNILADPTGPLGSKIRGVAAIDEALPNVLRTAKSRTSRAAIPGLADETAIAGARALARGEAGMYTAESIAFEQSKFGKWVTTHPGAVRVTEWVAGIASDPATSLETKTRIILENIDGLSPDVAKEFAQSNTVQKVQGVLGEASAKLANNPDDILLPKDIRKVSAAGVIKPWLDDNITERVPFYRSIRNGRILSDVPEQSLIINGSGLDKSKAVRTFSNYLKGTGFAEDSPEYIDMMDTVVRAVTTQEKAASRVHMKDAYDKVFKAIYEKAGGSKEDGVRIGQIMKEKADKNLLDARTYSINESGLPDDGGMMRVLLEHVDKDELVKTFGPDVLDNAVMLSPGALVEMADDVMVLPDFRELRALTGKLAFARKSKTIDGVRILAEYTQNEIWKPLTLASGGYIMRNMMDAQTRMAMGGLANAFTDPVDMIMWITRRKGKFDILGNEFDNAIGKEAAEFRPEFEKFYESLTYDIYRNMEDSSLAKQKMVRTGSFSQIERTGNRDAHTSAYVANLRQIFVDPVMNRMSRIFLASESRTDRLGKVKQWLTSPAGASAAESFRTYLQTGVKFTDPKTGEDSFIKLGKDIPDSLLHEWVDKLLNSKVETIVRGDEELRIIAGHNRVPLTKLVDGKVTLFNREVIDAADVNFARDLREGDGEVGSIISLFDGEGREYEGIIIGERTTKAKEYDTAFGVSEPGRKLIIQPVHVGEAFDGETGSDALRGLLNAKGDDGKLAQVVKRPEMGIAKDPNISTEFTQLRRRMVDFFFTSINGKATQVLEKSPTFRQFYFKEVLDTADLLSPTEARKLLDDIVKRADAEGMKPARYVGNKETLKKLADVAADSTSKANGTIDQLDGYAKAVALNQTKDLLYDASRKSNLEDMLRIIVPFGGAWREVLTTYATKMIEDPTRIRKAQLIFDGGRKYDSSITGGQEGQGFFYKDPVTGEYSFNFPASGWISELLTGVNAPMQAPVKRLSIGLGVIPSIGPVAQIAYSKLAPDTPSFDNITSILLPYGRKESVGFVPMWAKRMGEAWNANTTNLQSVYGNTYVDVLRALSTSGEYDLSDINEKEQLFADAKSKARVITGLRALGQFFGPTSPSPEFQIETASGDVYATQLVKEFQKLQDPNSIGADGIAGNYDTAVERFLKIYGNDAILYLSNKTESVAGGLEATEQFGDWERENGKLFSQYADVAGFMAPGGDDFSFEVWSRQLTSGKRRRLTDREIVDAAQYKAASAQYRSLRDQLPANPSENQRTWLRSWRVELNKQYPGFPVVAQFNPGEFPAKIAQMKNMVNEPSLADNDVAQALKQYLDARDSALANASAAGYSSLDSIAAAPLRDWLASIGVALKEETPEFARIYERLLSYEVEA
jgi:hypothetical protein